MVLSGFHEVRAEFTIGLAPKYLATVKEGITAQLNEGLLKYVDEFQGILMGHWKLRLTESVGQIPANSPGTCLVQASASFLVFCLAKGSALTGVVNRLGEHSIGLLVFGETSVNISANRMQGEHEYIEGQWVNKSSGKPVEDGQELCFSVESIRCEDMHFFIEGRS